MSPTLAFFLGWLAGSVIITAIIAFYFYRARP